MKLTLDQFDYHLPPERIAKYPAEPRDTSKLLVINRQTGELKDDHYYNLAEYLQPGDVLVRNNTKVIPARIIGKKDTGGKLELLLTKKLSHTAISETWECLSKPGLKPGQTANFGPNLTATCTGLSEDNYTRFIEFNMAGPEFIEELTNMGITPLPPYIAEAHTDENKFREQYQTIYAKFDGSAAAPTAGLHFTKELDTKLLERDIKIVEVTLHVGLGTFLPVKTKDITNHHMHSEWFELSEDAAQVIQAAKDNGSKIIAVGTTSNRVLETCSTLAEDGTFTIKPQIADTDIYIYPPYHYKCADALITNFHLPKSTLLMLVSAFVSHPNAEEVFTTFGESLIGRAYEYAIKNKYRFYSFGDGMIIL
ncbi:MAG: tRNA preQ1(34) S-adenosylmethionine ribosyltransferase-isomerase QueA [Pseudomonadales bacterium]|nr:tRNA preQ1(34) S-adenosylmethionine ribosyltransferase-isomerase QueA [Pseudomonadales bacterium]